jgi:hypothetical protein
MIWNSTFDSSTPKDANVLKYERFLAEKALEEDGTPGKWLLRFSSYNRPRSGTEARGLKRIGIVYYALSSIQKNRKVGHTLIVHQVGRGWAYTS